VTSINNNIDLLGRFSNGFTNAKETLAQAKNKIDFSYGSCLVIYAL
jgi:hypothetical protein